MFEVYGGVKGLVSKVFESRFVRSAGVLVGGTAAAQALTVLALPILTRLYSPEEFSLLAVYVAMLSIVSVIACLRLEIAIPLPEKDEDAASLLLLSLLMATVVALATGISVFLFGSSFFQLVGQPDMQSFGWLLPIGVWLVGGYAALQYWSTRKCRFPGIARTRITQVGAGLVAQLGLGWTGSGSVGLLIGHTLMSGAGVIGLSRQTFRNDCAALRSVSFTGLRKVLVSYRRFPQYSALEALANSAGIQLPLILIATLAVGEEAGFVLLATRVLGTPVALIGNATAQVYLSRAPDELRKGNLGKFTRDTLKGLAKISVVPILLIAVTAPFAFELVFGQEWGRAGELVAWMSPWFLFRLLSSPVSMVMHVKMLQKIMLALTIGGLILRVGAVLLAYYFNGGLITEAYAISSALFYFFLFFVFSFYSGAFQKK